MTADLMGDSVKDCPGALCNPPSMLVFCAFRGYVPDELKVKLTCDSHWHGSELQPLDVSVNEPFKHCLRK
jgi:hypothetical protein